MDSSVSFGLTATSALNCQRVGSVMVLVRGVVAVLTRSTCSAPSVKRSA